MDFRLVSMRLSTSNPHLPVDILGAQPVLCSNYDL